MKRLIAQNALAMLVLSATMHPRYLSADEVESQTLLSPRVRGPIVTEPFDAAQEYARLPTRGSLVTLVDLTGTWIRPGGFDQASFTFDRQPDGGYLVHFSTSDCVGGWKTKHLASYSASTIRLDTPVYEIMPATYTRLYSVHYLGQTYLISSNKVQEFDQLADDHPFNLARIVFARRSESKSVP